jgi:Na+-transporting methylmalonyl-CoA/oxaloacetate decarboxylase gamma subunit
MVDLNPPYRPIINMSDLIRPILLTADGIPGPPVPEHDDSSDGISSSGGSSSSSSISLENLEISAHKLALVLGITFGFILLLLFSLICIFYVMGFLQNVFGYSWGPPQGRIISSAAFYPDLTDVTSNHLNHHTDCHAGMDNHPLHQPLPPPAAGPVCTHAYGHHIQRC